MKHDDCAVSLEMLERKLVGDLSPAEVCEAEEHLRGCELCRRRLAELEEEWMLLAAALDLPEAETGGLAASTRVPSRWSRATVFTAAAAAVLVVVAAVWGVRRFSSSVPPRVSFSPAEGVLRLADASGTEQSPAWYAEEKTGGKLRVRSLTGEKVPLRRVVLAWGGGFALGGGTTMALEEPGTFAVQATPKAKNGRVRVRLFEGKFRFEVPDGGRRVELDYGGGVIRDTGTVFTVRVKPPDGKPAEATERKGAWNMERLRLMSERKWRALVGVVVLAGVVVLNDHALGEEKIKPETERLLKYDKDGDGVLSEEERRAAHEAERGGIHKRKDDDGDDRGEKEGDDGKKEHADKDDEGDDRGEKEGDDGKKEHADKDDDGDDRGEKEGDDGKKEHADKDDDGDDRGEKEGDDGKKEHADEGKKHPGRRGGDEHKPRGDTF